MPAPEAVRRHKPTDPALRVLSSFILAALLVSAGAGVGYQLGTRKAQQGAPGSKADLGLFWKAWGILDTKFYGDLPTDKRVDGAIGGMVAGLGDPYTVYLPPSQNSLFHQDLQGSFGGIGAELEVRNGQLVVVSALSGTPAEKVGLKANDVITKIDGKKAESMTFTDAINAIRGAVGSTLNLEIARPGAEKPLDLAIVRDTITVKSVSSSVIGAKNDTLYIKVNQFGEDTTSAFREALTQATGKKGLVIDLRNNPGGYLADAEAMIGMVLPQSVTASEQPLKDRVAVIERGRTGETQDKAGTDVVAPDIPIVILINEGSASASEIFSGALKDYKRATLVGVKSFGKGSVQELQDLGNGGSIKVTVAKWFTPLGTGIDGKGIEPDVTVALPDGVTASTSDVQVQKALDILSSK